MPGEAREPLYFDTSALAKWYLNEERSDDVARFIVSRGAVDISDLVAVEFRCLLARRRRNKELTRDVERRVATAFERDQEHGFLVRHPVPSSAFREATRLIEALPSAPLRTLDALHLAVAMDIGAKEIATADRVMADAAKRLGLTVARFG